MPTPLPAYRPVVAVPTRGVTRATAPEKPVPAPGAAAAAPQQSFDWAALLAPRTKGGGELALKAGAPKTRKKDEAPAADPVTAELRALSKDVRAAAQLKELAAQVDEIADYHLGDVQYETPGEQMEQALSRVVLRGAALLEKGASKEAVANLQDSAIGLLAERVLGKVNADVARLDAKTSLVPYDRQKIGWTYTTLRPLREALAKAQEGGAKTEKLRASLAAIDAKLVEISIRPDYVHPNTPEAKAADAALFEKALAGIKSKQAPGEEWKDWAEKDRATTAVWRGLMADALALINQPVDRLELAGDVGFGLFGRGLKLLGDHHASFSKAAVSAKTEAQRAAYAEMAAENAELWIRAVASRGAYQLADGASLEAVYLLSEPLKQVSALPSPPPSLAAALAEARRVFDAALPAALEGARALIQRGEAIFQKGEKPYQMQRDAEMSLLQLRRLDAGTPGLAEITASLRSLYTRAHLTGLREELDEGKRALAALKASPTPQAIEDADSARSVAEMASWPRENPSLDPALLGDKPALVSALEAIAAELEAELARHEPAQGAASTQTT